MERMSYRLSAISTAMLVAGLVGSQGAHAAAFALYEQSASGMGNAFAGMSAVAEDASTVFWNPAGMSRLKGNRIAVAGHLIMPSTKFTDGGSASPATKVLGTNTGGDAGGNAVVPNFYLTTEIDSRWHFGLGINVPFGLATEYDERWIGRFQGIKSSLEAFNFNPSLSYKVSDGISVGAGLSYQTLTAQLISMSNIPGVAEFKGNINASSEAFGWNAGGLFDLTPSTTLGLAYRSRIQHGLEGNVNFIDRPAAVAGLVPDGAVEASVSMPATFSASLSHKLNTQWNLLADVTWTGWKKIQSINIMRTGGASLQTLNLGFTNTARYSFGANYQMNDKWMLKAGVAWDESPVPNANVRSVRLPDSDRTWLSFGAKYYMSPTQVVDLGFAHVKVKDAQINNVGGVAAAAGQTGNIIGSYKASVNILSVQYNHQF